MTRGIQPWTVKPTCTKCRKQAPRYLLTRVLPGEPHTVEHQQAFLKAQWDAEYRLGLPEAIELTCERCGHTWFMATAPPEARPA